MASRPPYPHTPHPPPLSPSRLRCSTPSRRGFVLPRRHAHGSVRFSGGDRVPACLRVPSRSLSAVLCCVGCFVRFSGGDRVGRIDGRGGGRRGSRRRGVPRGAGGGCGRRDGRGGDGAVRRRSGAPGARSLLSRHLHPRSPGQRRESTSFD